MRSIAWWWILYVSAIAAGWNALRADQPTAKYRSPYSVRFSVPAAQLTEDFSHGERGDSRAESEIPHSEWYSAATRQRWKSWGPPARSYAALPPKEFAKHSTAWKRERVIAVATRFIGYDYQHHHIPDWNPRGDWPWKETVTGHNSKGIDCSNFSSFVYNQAFGIQLDSEVERQSELTQAKVASQKRQISLKRIDLPASYAERIKVLRTGDLLFIRNAKGERISHVVLWVGASEQSSDSTPLVIDSHGETVRDHQKNAIPTGVQLRPFREAGWYNRSASHALRVFRDDSK